MSADCTLPPLPEHNGWNNELGKPYWFAVFVLQHGQQCAEAARAPLLQRIAELERAASSLLEVVDSASENGAFWHKPVNRSLDARNHAAELNDVLRAEIESARKIVKESGDA